MSGANEELARQRAEVAATRERLASRLEQADEEVRAQVATTGKTIAWKIGSAAAAFLAALATRKALTLVWTRARGSEPPEDPTDPDTRWADALGWTVATTVGIGVAQLVARRGAAAGWTRATGERPPSS